MIIYAHEEFSPPKLGLITVKNKEYKARLPNPATKVTQLCCDNYKQALSLLFFAGFAVLSKTQQES